MSDPSLYNAILEENKILQTTIQAAEVEALNNALCLCPWDTYGWQLLPLLASPTDCLCVYDNASGYLRCGACCEWVVPSGASKIQFQIWGAGSGTGVPCCCGGAPFGSNGAFATVIIDAVEGCSYTLCAGCALCCYSCTTSGCNCADGCPSFVTGYNLTGFCADGGQGNVDCQMFLQSNATCSRYQAPGRTVSGPCTCYGSQYCFNGCATCGEVPFAIAPGNTWHGTSGSGTVCGFSSVFGNGYLNTGNCGYHGSAPVISVCHTCTTESACCWTFTDQACYGGCLCNGSLTRLFPGAGAWGTHITGGSTTHQGDAGRGGMVRVTWC